MITKIRSVAIVVKAKMFPILPCFLSTSQQLWVYFVIFFQCIMHYVFLSSTPVSFTIESCCCCCRILKNNVVCVALPIPTCVYTLFHVNGACIPLWKLLNHAFICHIISFFSLAWKANFNFFLFFFICQTTQWFPSCLGPS